MNDPLFHNMDPDIFGMQRCLNMSQPKSLFNQLLLLGLGFELLSPNCERQYNGTGFDFTCETIALAKQAVETQFNSWCEMSSMNISSPHW